MAAIQFLVHPHLTPEACHAEESHYLNVVGRTGRPHTGLLRVYGLAGEVLSIGRYHLVSDAMADSRAIRVHRRRSGGRAVPCGDGFVGLTLVLPHRAFLFADDPLGLAAYQVMNRYARGILEACRLAGVPAFYPGRDWLTVQRRAIALVSFEVDPSGALLFEAILANQRDFSDLPRLLGEVGAEDVVKTEVLDPKTVTCLAREVGADLSIHEVAELLRRGFEKQFGLIFEPHDSSPLEQRLIDSATTHSERYGRWLRRRRVRADLVCHACARVQLGFFEVFLSLAQSAFIKDIMFVGDFIANSAGVERLERDLRLCPTDWRAIDTVASTVFSQPENYLLGIGPLRTIADTIVQALPS
jgi:lipoate-protein ligase A